MATIDTRKPQSKKIYHYLRDKFEMSLAVTDQDGAAVDLSAKTLVFSIRTTENGTAVQTATGAEIVVSGTSNNIVTITKSFTGLAERAYYYDLHNSTDSETIIDGAMICNYKGR